MKAISLLLAFCLLTPMFGQELPDAPKPVPAYAPQEPHILPYYTVLPEKHRSWAYRHRTPLWILGSGAVAAGIVLATRQHGCPHYINGVGYDGTPPCPKSCEGPGDCYWGPRK
jgi:hypothetical protein